jgi:hypothetical protein
MGQNYRFFLIKNKGAGTTNLGDWRGYKWGSGRRKG